MIAFTIFLSGLCNYYDFFFFLPNAVFCTQIKINSLEKKHKVILGQLHDYIFHILNKPLSGRLFASNFGLQYLNGGFTGYQPAKCRLWLEANASFLII